MLNRYLIFAMAAAWLFYFQSARAAQLVSVDYADKVIVDSDLDGLTDEGERQLYGTDPEKFDSDEDNLSDGVEVVAGTDPLLGAVYENIVAGEEGDLAETPWAWQISRASGLVAFGLLYISIFLGLTLRIPLLRKIFSPAYSLKAHGWIALQATALAFLHGAVLALDKFLNLSLLDLFVPFASPFQPGLLALGAFGFYLMILLVATSYGRKYISPKLWRAAHFTNIILYVSVLIHAFKLGTDLQKPLVFGIFLWSNAFLILLMLINMQLRLSEARRRRKELAAAQRSNSG